MGKFREEEIVYDRWARFRLQCLSIQMEISSNIASHHLTASLSDLIQPYVRNAKLAVAKTILRMEDGSSLRKIPLSLENSRPHYFAAGVILQPWH